MLPATRKRCDVYPIAGAHKEPRYNHSHMHMIGVTLTSGEIPIGL